MRPDLGRLQLSGNVIRSFDRIVEAFLWPSDSIHMASMDNRVVHESRGDAISAPRLLSTACLRCREQKVIPSSQRFKYTAFLTTNHSQLRCGRERPRCTRCDRLDATCQYPSPPNRRGPRGQRNGTQRLQRTTECGRERTRPRRAVLQRPDNGPRPQHIPAQRLNAVPRHRITSLGRDNLPQEHTFPDNDDESDDMSVPPVTGTPVLSNVRTNAHFLLHRRVTLR